jgi:phytoene dehydrogenase-like protein
MSVLKKEAAEEGYDVIVVGSGIGGLSAGALLAKAGKKVLVLEREEQAGGNLHSQQYGDYVLDAAMHILGGGCGSTVESEYGVIDSLLQLLGIRQECNFLRVSPIYTAVFPDFRLQAPLGLDPFQHEHARRFPTQEKYIRDLLVLCAQTRQELRAYPLALSFWDLLLFPNLFPSLYRYARAPLTCVLDEYLTDPRLKSAFSAMWLHLGLPPSRVSFLSWAVSMVNYIEEGAFYCRGSLQKMIDAFVEAVQRNDGQVLLETPVQRIVVEDEQVRGVLLGTGQRIQSPIVISNADVLQTFETLVGYEHLPAAHVTKIRKLKPSLSSCVISVATDLDLPQLGLSHEMLMFTHWDHDETYADIMEGRPSGITMHVPSMIDPSLAPPGEHILSISALVPARIAARWSDEKHSYTEAMLGLAEAMIPDLQNHISTVAGGPSRIMHVGIKEPACGWEPSPEHVEEKQLGHETPIRGLYLSGHWSQPGLGLYTSIASGIRTAQLILQFSSTENLLRNLQLPV